MMRVFLSAAGREITLEEVRNCGEEFMMLKENGEAHETAFQGALSTSLYPPPSVDHVNENHERTDPELSPFPLTIQGLITERTRTLALRHRDCVFAAFSHAASNLSTVRRELDLADAPTASEVSIQNINALEIYFALARFDELEDRKKIIREMLLMNEFEACRELLGRSLEILGVITVYPVSRVRLRNALDWNLKFDLIVPRSMALVSYGAKEVVDFLQGFIQYCRKSVLMTNEDSSDSSTKVAMYFRSLMTTLISSSDHDDKSFLGAVWAKFCKRVFAALPEDVLPKSGTPLITRKKRLDMDLQTVENKVQTKIRKKLVAVLPFANLEESSAYFDLLKTFIDFEEDSCMTSIRVALGNFLENFCGSSMDLVKKLYEASEPKFRRLNHIELCSNVGISPLMLNVSEAERNGYLNKLMLCFDAVPAVVREVVLKLRYPGLDMSILEAFSLMYRLTECSVRPLGNNVEKMMEDYFPSMTELSGKEVMVVLNGGEERFDGALSSTKLREVANESGVNQLRYLQSLVWRKMSRAPVVGR